MLTETLKELILEKALRGQLVPQDSKDEPASILLSKIISEKQGLKSDGLIKKTDYFSVIKKKEDGHIYEKCLDVENDITNEVPFDLPSGWEYTKLVNVCWLYDVKESKSGALPYLDAKTLRTGSVHDIANTGKVIDTGDRVILVDGENSGEVFVAPFKGYMGSTLKLLGISNYINDQYLNIILDYYKQKFRTNKVGSAIPHLDKALFKSIIIGLPPYLEQERIVEKVESLRHQIEHIEKRRIALAKDALVFEDKIFNLAIQGKLIPQDSSDESVSVLMEKITAGRKLVIGGSTKKGIPVVYKDDKNDRWYEKTDDNVKDISDEIPFDIPDSWSWGRIGNVVCVNPSNCLPDETEVSFVEMSAIKGGYGSCYTYETRTWGKVKKGYTHFSNNDVGFAKIAPCFQNRKSAVFKNLKNGQGAGTTELHILRTIPNTILPEYLLCFVQSPYFIQKGLATFSGMVGQQRFATDELIKMLIPLPPFAEQERIVKEVGKYEALLERLKRI